MKKNILSRLVALVALLSLCGIANAQINYNSHNCHANGLYSSAIGDGCISRSNYSFAGGRSSFTGYSSESSFSFGDGCVANGSYSKAMGYNAVVSYGTGSTAIGNEVTVSSSAATAIGTYITVNRESIAIGRGMNNTDRMLVDRNGVIALGFNSNIPTMIIFSAPGKNNTGKVAIGNVTGNEPGAKLHIAGCAYDEADILLQSQGSHKAAVCFQSEENQISVGTGSNIMNFTAGSYDFNTKGALAMNVGSAAITSGDAVSLTAPSCSLNISKVGIGCVNNVEGFALAVKGGVVSTEMSVMDVDLWPDFVFSSDYNRMSLYELERYISQNHHLPEIPSAEEVSANGINLGEMNALLLQKVEELTLHVIELQKQIDLQQNEIDELKSR